MAEMFTCHSMYQITSGDSSLSRLYVFVVGGLSLARGSNCWATSEWLAVEASVVSIRNPAELRVHPKNSMFTSCSLM